MALANPANGALLARLRPLRLPECHLAAGCLFQAVWNLASGRRPQWGVKDYDVFYFDDRDLSVEAEDAVIRRVHEATADLGIEVEVRNQARVHIWYPQHFKRDYSPLRSAREGIDRFLVACTCVGIESESGDVYAPNGLQDLASGSLRMNPLCAFPELFQAKARSYQARWPWLQVVT
jgi:hypothetical protein